MYNVQCMRLLKTQGRRLYDRKVQELLRLFGGSLSLLYFPQEILENSTMNRYEAFWLSYTSKFS